MEATDLPPIVVQDFSGGVNQSTTSNKIADNEMEDCTNFNINEDKTLTSRKGPDQHNPTLTGSGRVTSLFYAKKMDGSASLLLATTAQKVYKDNGAGGWTDITGATTPPNDTLWMWSMFNNNVIGVNGSTVPQKNGFSGNLSDLGGSPPDKCKIIVPWRGRVYLAGDGDEPTALHGCAADDSEDWTTAGDAFTIYVDKDNGEPITGIAAFFDFLIIFKRKGVYKLVNPDNDPASMSLFQIFNDVGCVSPHTVKQIGNEVVWLDDDGVYALQSTQDSGDVAYASSSRKIQPTIDSLNYAYLQYAAAVDVRPHSQYRFAVPNGAATTNDFMIVRDYYHGAWIFHEGIAMASFGQAEINSEKVRIGGGYNGKVYILDTLESDDGAAFSKSMSTKRFDHGAGMLRKFYPQVYNELKMESEYSVGFTAEFDYGDRSKGATLTGVPESTRWDYFNWDEADWAGQSITRKWTKLGKRAKNIQCSYLNENVDEPVTIIQSVIPATLLSWRG